MFGVGVCFSSEGNIPTCQKQFGSTVKNEHHYAEQNLRTKSIKNTHTQKNLTNSLDLHLFAFAKILCPVSALSQLPRLKAVHVCPETQAKERVMEMWGCNLLFSYAGWVAGLGRRPSHHSKPFSVGDGLQESFSQFCFGGIFWKQQDVVAGVRGRQPEMR